MANDETDIIKIFEFLIDNIFVIFGGRVFQHAVGIHKSANLGHDSLNKLWLPIPERD
jgi:hypothetical protein